MPGSRRTPTRPASVRASRDALAIATGAPQVIAMRVARMAAHGATPSARDRLEMQRMVAEKVAAFGESWRAMFEQSLRMQQSLWRQSWQPSVWQPSFWPAWLRPWSLGASTRPASLASTLNRGLPQLAAAGLAPVSRRVRSNVARLGAPGRKRR